MGKRGQVLPMLAKNIRRFRKERGFSQEELAARSGLSSIKMIEAGHYTGSVQSLSAIAEALDVTIEDLLADPSAPMPAALEAFLRTPGASEITAQELEYLRLVRARGKRPTSDTYYWALKMLRSMSTENGG